MTCLARHDKMSNEEDPAVQRETGTCKPALTAEPSHRASRLSIAFSIAGLVMGLACWAGLAALYRYATNEASAMIGWYLMFFTGSVALVLGLIFSAVAYVPRGRVWPLATISLLVNLAFPCFFAASAIGLQEGLMAVGGVCVVVGAVVGVVLLMNHLAKRGGWSGRVRATALILSLSIVGLLAFVLFVLLTG